MKDYQGEYSCKYIGHTNWEYVLGDKIKIYSDCNLDYYSRECEGKCSRYVEKTIFQKMWDKFLNQSSGMIITEFFGLVIALLILLCKLLSGLTY